MKFVLLLLVAVACWWWWRRPRVADRSARRGAPTAEGMRACAHCGVYLPASDALVDGEAAYCCAEHRVAGPARR